MGDYRSYHYKRRPDQRKPKKKRGPVGKALLLGILLFLVFVLGATAYVVLDTYDFSLKAAFSDIFKKDSEEENVPPEEPQPEGAATFLAAVTANREEDVFAFIIIRTDLGKKTFRTCALPPQTLVQGALKEETMEEMLYLSGISAVCDAVEKTYGITIDRYIRATQGGFEKLVDQLGGVRFHVEKDLVYSTNTLSMHVQGGNQKLTGAAALHVMRYPEWEQGEMYQYQIQAQVAAALIDQNLNAKNAEKGDEIFNNLINLVQSDISIADYRATADEIGKYAVLLDKNPTQAVVAQGAFTETEDGKRAFRVSGDLRSALMS